MKTLAIFDFDDTLFKSGAKVIVVSGNNKKRSLSSKQYAGYVAKEDDQFDFSEFDSYPPNPVAIQKVITIFKTYADSIGNENVVILTARSKSKPVADVLANFSLPSVNIAVMSSSDHNKKAEYAKSLIQNIGYDNVVLFEDNQRNIDAIKEVVVDLLGIESFTGFKVVTAKGRVKIVSA